ncbi:MAG: O-antigen ligase family protein [Sedimentisphaerales bacterium]|nr:O-antigen ligase family protein [Sedimentisphaerales bacterium]MBN2844254.1 O-antigen ligase family protein [Sedimentisphaerales bacterium]
MTEKPGPEPLKYTSNIITIADSIAFFIITAVVLCRLFISESLFQNLPHPGQNIGTGILGFGSAGLMLSFNMLTLLACALWVAIRFYTQKLIWHKTLLCLPGLLLLTAAMISVSCASNFHLAFNDSLNLISAFAVCLIMPQLLIASENKRKFLLIFILALGSTLSIRCYQQKHYEHGENIKAMQSNYNEFMLANGLEPDSWQAYQLEERILSMDTGGYFPISNTAASYLLLTVGAALALAISGGKKALLCGLATLILLTYGIYLTDSTGGKSGLALLVPATVLFGLLMRINNRPLLFGGFIVILIAGIAAVTSYGILYDRLPTSNLWIRWQYWQATVKMIADHWLTGVGPLNFGSYYPIYMNPTSPELVKDPHCVALSIFSQWGITGFIAMVWATLAVVWQMLNPEPASINIKTTKPEKLKPVSFLTLTLGLTACSVAVQMLSQDETGGKLMPEAVFYIIFTRSGVFMSMMIAIWYFLFRLNIIETIFQNRRSQAALFASLAVFALHNCIDFAFFTPGVTLLCALTVALLLALKNSDTPGSIYTVTSRKYSTLVATVILIGVSASWFYAGRHIYNNEKMLNLAARYAINAGDSGQPGLIEQAAAFAIKASETHPGDPTGYKYAGELYAALWHNTKPKDDNILHRALKYLDLAIKTDPANSSCYQLAGNLHRDRASHSSGVEKYNALQLAINYYNETLKRYPGNSDVMLHLAEILQATDQQEKARELARKSLEIEQGCLNMQSELFPHRKHLYPRMDISLQLKAKNMLDSK